MKQTFIIGLGNKARQGKDTVANFIRDLRSVEQVTIIHFADELYAEVTNQRRKYPLIKKTTSKPTNDIYFVLNDAKTGQYLLFESHEVPLLNEIFEKRGLSIYWGMDKKDPEMLQFWGTQFRRKQNEDYWVDRVNQQIIEMYSNNSPYFRYICIPDMRFKNELDCIRKLASDVVTSVFVRVVRTNQDGSIYIDSSRDSNHPSEIDLDNEIADYTISANSGDLDSLQVQTEDLIRGLENEYSLR